MRNFTLLLLISLSLSNCSPSFQQYNEKQIQDAKNYWLGRTGQELLDHYGLPHETRDHGDDYILTYKRDNGLLVWVTEFYVKADGSKIYNMNVYSE